MTDLEVIPPEEKRKLEAEIARLKADNEMWRDLADKAKEAMLFGSDEAQEELAEEIENCSRYERIARTCKEAKQALKQHESEAE